MRLTKEGVESLCILLYTSVNVHLVNSQWSKPENQRGQQSKCQKELVKVLTCGRSCDYRTYGSDTPCSLSRPFIQHAYRSTLGIAQN